MKFKISGDSGATLWFLQRLTGIYLVIALLIHFWVIHYSGDGKVTYEIVVKKLASPMYKVLDLTFLALAIYHGLNGAWMVIQDYVQCQGRRVCLYSITVMLGLVLLVLGTISLIKI